MKFIMEQGYDVEQGRMREFQTWLREHEGELAKACPAGVEYLGTYAVIYTDQSRSGACRTLWRLDSYGAQDTFAEEAGRDTPFGRLLAEAIAFSDSRNDANGTQSLLKAMADATLWE
jgi:hypothetical protein